MNRKEFKAAMYRQGFTQKSLAKELGISESAMIKKLSGLTEFRLSEQKQIAKILKLDQVSFLTIFEIDFE